MSFLSDAFSLQSVPICDQIFRVINHLRSYNHCSLLLYSAQAAWRSLSLAGGFMDGQAVGLGTYAPRQGEKGIRIEQITLNY